MKNHNNLSAMLNKRIIVEEAIETSDGAGGFAVNWTPKITLWAMIMPISAIENFEANKIEGTVSHIIIIRYIAGINTKMRIIYDGRIFNINGVINVMENRRALEIRAEEKL
jgi:SPP1 family predicted phage head-tail adaptor